MATSIQIIEQGYRNLIIKVDGTGGDVNTIIVNPATLTPPCTRVRLEQGMFSLASGGTATLSWDATTPIILLNFFGGNDAYFELDLGISIPNNAGAGITGKVLLSTSATPFTLLLYFTKKDSYLAA